MPVMLGGAALVVAIAINIVAVVSFLRGRRTRNIPER
jgi:hypothetical protein